MIHKDTKIKFLRFFSDLTSVETFFKKKLGILFNIYITLIFLHVIIGIFYEGLEIWNSYALLPFAIFFVIYGASISLGNLIGYLYIRFIKGFEVSDWATWMIFAKSKPLKEIMPDVVEDSKYSFEVAYDMLSLIKSLERYIGHEFFYIDFYELDCIRVYYVFDDDLVAMKLVSSNN